MELIGVRINELTLLKTFVNFIELNRAQLLKFMATSNGNEDLEDTDNNMPMINTSIRNGRIAISK